MYNTEILCCDNEEDIDFIESVLFDYDIDIVDARDVPVADIIH